MEHMFSFFLIPRIRTAGSYGRCAFSYLRSGFIKKKKEAVSFYLFKFPLTVYESSSFSNPWYG